MASVRPVVHCNCTDPGTRAPKAEKAKAAEQANPAAATRRVRSQLAISQVPEPRPRPSPSIVSSPRPRMCLRGIKIGNCADAAADLGAPWRVNKLGAALLLVAQGTEGAPPPPSLNGATVPLRPTCASVRPWTIASRRIWMDGAFRRGVRFRQAGTSFAFLPPEPSIKPARCIG